VPESLRTVCKELGIHHTTVLSWARDNPQFADQYARARVIADDVDFDDIVDDASEPPPTVKGFVDAGWVAWKKNRIDAKKWSLSKRRPKKYGDRTTTALVGADDGPIKVEVEDVKDKLRARLGLIAKATPTPEVMSETRTTEMSDRAGGDGDYGKR
jgi:hypothetical protein